jgi:4-amino-4-deoxy-L-arabinose transferase-like glycosyltransferase
VLRRLRQVPLPLAVLLAVAVIEASAWIVLVPPLQGPDEVSHYTYVERIAEKHDIPWSPAGSNSGGAYSEDVSAALRAAGIGALAANVSARPLWSPADEAVWRRAAVGASRENDGYTSAYRNPPVYYLYQVFPYELASGGSFFDREIMMRLANVPIFVAMIVFAWLLAGELLGRGLMQLTATAAVAFAPQLLNLVATVNPDILLAAEWTAALWLMTLAVRRGPRALIVVPLLLLCVVGAFTQPRSIPLFLPAAMAIFFGWARDRDKRVSPVAIGVGMLVLYVPTVFFLAGRGAGEIREFGSYLWQFYLPKLSFMQNTIGPVSYDFRTGFVDRIYGTLAQLEVVLPRDLERALYAITLIGLAALVVALVVRRQSVRRNAAVAVVLFTTVWSLVLALHLIAYRAMVNVPGDPIITGRYLLPLISLFGVAIGIVGLALPLRIRAVYAGVVVAVGVALQFASAGLLLERFYA